MVIAGIPCFNTSSRIVDVVTASRPWVDEVLVVDDGSTDNTGELAAKAGATVVRHLQNMGTGASLRTCFEYASIQGAAVLVTLDGDGQHYPQDIPRLVAPILEGRASMVVGSRFLHANHSQPVVNMPRYRAFGIRAITFLFNLASGCRLSDSQCGLRAYDSHALRELVPRSNGFEWSVELLVKARAKSLRMVEVPVGCRYHEEGSTMNPVPQGMRLALAVLRLRAAAVLGRWRRRVLKKPADESPACAVGGQGTCSREVRHS